MTRYACCGLVAALVLLAPAAAEECQPGYTAVPVRVENASGGEVTASLRAARGGNWRSLAVAAGGSGEVAPCLQMVLAVASAEWEVADGSGTVLCAGSKLVSEGAAVTLLVEGADACTLKVAQ